MKKDKILNTLIPYILIARPDHWFKNVFMIPGIIFAIYDSPSLLSWKIIPKILLGFLAAFFISSTNYIINEILDAPKDGLHPVKKTRPIPSGKIKLPIAYAECVVLGLTGITIGWIVNIPFFITILFFLVIGLFYNIPPIRFKDLPYIDVLSESANNPIRLFLGWFIVNNKYLPTLSLILAYWMIGAFFMSVKRYAEYRQIGDPVLAEKYRKSFSYYTEYRLILSIVYYVSAFSLFFGIFLIRYRIELILSVPFLAGFISMYMRVGFWKNSPAQYPERLYKQKGLVIYSLFCFILILCLLFIDIPVIEKIFQPYHIPGK